MVPNLDLTQKTNEAYIEMTALAQKERDANTSGTYEMAHMNFLRRVVEWNYYYNREADAVAWLKKALDMYPEKMKFFTGYNRETDTYDLDKFVLNRLEDGTNRGGIDKTLAILIGLMIRHYTHLALGEEEQAVKYFEMAEDLHQRFTDRFATAAENRVSLPPFEAVRHSRLRAFLLEEDPVLVARLRTVLGLKEDELPEEPTVEGPQPNPNE